MAVLAEGPALATAGDAPGSKDRGQHWAATDADGDGASSLAEAQAGLRSRHAGTAHRGGDRQGPASPPGQ